MLSLVLVFDKLGIDLSTKFGEGPSWGFHLVKAPTSAFTLNNLSRHHAKWELEDLNYVNVKLGRLFPKSIK